MKSLGLISLNNRQIIMNGMEKKNWLFLLRMQGQKNYQYIRRATYLEQIQEMFYSLQIVISQPGFFSSTWSQLFTFSQQCINIDIPVVVSPGTPNTLSEVLVSVSCCSMSSLLFLFHLGFVSSLSFRTWL